MTVATRKLLLDVREAGESILQHTAGKSLAEYSVDRFFRRAVEREFEIIGEALNRIDRLDPPTVHAFLNCGASWTFATESFTAMTAWTTQWCGESWRNACRY
jgi:hypothetical protein